MAGGDRPDIVCLQETKCPDDQFPALALQAAGYYAAYHGEKSYNGVAILCEYRAARRASSRFATKWSIRRRA